VKSLAVIKAKARLIENVQTVVTNLRSHTVVCDLPKNLGGDDSGPTALELAVMAIADCAATIYADVAKKSNIELTKLEVTAEAVKADDAPVIKSVDIKVKVASKARESLLKACLRRTEANCPVLSIYKEPVPINVALEVESSE